MVGDKQSISNSLLKIICYILSFNNLLKVLASEKNDHF